jgi:hypothetical protein
MDNAAMRLTKAEIADLKAKLAEWQTPQAVSDLYDATVERIGSVTLFNQGGLAFLRDAYVAAEFAKARKADKVRLVAGTWPDFELLIDGRVEPFEAVEADEPGRQRGREYAQDDGEVELDPIENWIARGEAAPSWIETVCRIKAAKHYGGRANLVVYLNMNEFGIRQAEIVSSFPHATQAAKDAFDSVWVFWHQRAYRAQVARPRSSERRVGKGAKRVPTRL